MLKLIAKEFAIHTAGIVIGVATLAAIGYVATAVHKRNCENDNCPGPGICTN